MRASSGQCVCACVLWTVSTRVTIYERVPVLWRRTDSRSTPLRGMPGIQKAVSVCLQTPPVSDETPETPHEASSQAAEDRSRRRLRPLQQHAGHVGGRQQRDPCTRGRQHSPRPPCWPETASSRQRVFDCRQLSPRCAVWSSRTARAACLHVVRRADSPSVDEVKPEPPRWCEGCKPETVLSGLFVTGSITISAGTCSDCGGSPPCPTCLTHLTRGLARRRTTRSTTVAEI